VGWRACYDEGKRFGEALTMSYHRRHGTDATIVRIFNTYGPRMREGDGRVIPALIGAALDGRPMPLFGDGRQTRSFCHVTDLVEGLLRVAFDASSAGEVFNLGNPHEVSMLELARTIASITGRGSEIVHLPAVADDPARRRPDITRVRDRYGWEPRVSLEDGLRDTIAWFEQARAGLTLLEAA
jgi:dTDP-glucose 4,6-dehydratase